jgi:hypothetical protein
MSSTRPHALPLTAPQEAKFREVVDTLAADGVISPPELKYLCDAVQTLKSDWPEPKVRALALEMLRAFAPHARVGSSENEASRLMPLRPLVLAASADGQVSVKEIELLATKLGTMHLVRPGEHVGTLIRSAFRLFAPRAQLARPALDALATLANVIPPITVTVSADGMTASARVEKGQRWGAAELQRALSAARVTFGVDPKWFDPNLRAPMAGATLQLATGQSPTVGFDGFVEWQTIPRRPVSVFFNDWRRAPLVEVVSNAVPTAMPAGVAIGAAHPPVPGKEGRTVTGESIAGICGRPPPELWGAGLALGEDGTAIVTTDDGALVDLGASMRAVTTVREVDVHLAEDEVPAPFVHDGTLILRGDLRKAVVVARHDIIVDGSVEESTIVAGGHVIVTRGCHDASVVRAGGDVVVRGVGGQTSVVASASVVVLTSAARAVIEAGFLAHVRGAITSSVVRAGGIVDVADVASNASARSVLSVIGPMHRPEAPKPRAPAAPKAAVARTVRAVTGARSLPDGAPEDPRGGAPKGATPPRIFNDNQIAKLRERIAERELLHDIDEAIVRARKESDATLRAPGFVRRVVINTSIASSAIVKIGETELTVEAPLGPSLLTRERDAVVAVPLED